MGTWPSSSGPKPYDESDRDEIHGYALGAKGRTAREICSLSGMPDPSTRPGWSATKGVLGDVMEAYFGIPKNNSPLPDFPAAELELKVLPLKRGRQGLQVKEPTSISMIDYARLPAEIWGKASVRKKLGHILFAFFSIDPVDIMASTLRDVVLWEPAPVAGRVLEMDWTRTRDMVRSGKAHELSESQAEALAARRKGTGGAGEVLRRYRDDAPPAKSRAWALKSAFTRQIFEERVLHHEFEPALPAAVARSARDPVVLAEERIRTVLAPYYGWTLREIAELRGLPPEGGKNLAATIIKRALGFRNVRAKILELEQLGIDVKTLNLRSSDGWPFQAVSFPAVDLVELAGQEWEGAESGDGTLLKEGSELHDQLHRILFVPTFSTRDKQPQALRRLGRPFGWSPSPVELGTIRREWEMYRQEVTEGKAAYRAVAGTGRRRNDLTKSSQTEVIHMRPHGRVAKDEVPDPRGNMVTKQCFWLNQKFVQGLVRKNAWPPPAEP